ncbi:hypothetical protein K437DRAFT_265240, partial [Tilletiaria anomala UBC 951]
MALPDAKNDHSSEPAPEVAPGAGEGAAATTAAPPSSSPSPSPSASSSSETDAPGHSTMPPLDRKISRSEADLQRFAPHHSALPMFFYLFSFAPPLLPPPSSSSKISTVGRVRALVTHPLTLYLLGVFAALVAGIGMVSLDLIYGRLWSNSITRAGSTPHTIQSKSDLSAGLIAAVGLVQCLATWLFLTCFSAGAHLLTVRLQHAYVASVLAQDSTYFDLHGAGEIATRAGKEINAVRVGFGEKMGYAVWSTSTLLASVTSAFVNAPRVAGVLFTAILFLLFAFAALAALTELIGTPALRLEGLAASLLEQILASVRVVQSFGMEQNLLTRLDTDILHRLQRFGIGRAFVRAAEMATIYFTLATMYALGFHWGSVQIVQHGLPVGTVLTAFWNIFNSLFAVTNVVPHLSGIFDAYVCIKTLRAAIERQPVIDVRSPDGLCFSGDDDGVAGNVATTAPSIELHDVTFAYPARPTVASLKEVSMLVQGGKVTALVGPSGSGKSTIVSLLLREYDPHMLPNPADNEVSKLLDKAHGHGTKSKQEGGEEKNRAKQSWLHRFTPSKRRNDMASEQSDEGQVEDIDIEKAKKPPSTRVTGSGRVLFAGHDIRELNLASLRSQISVVQQHPAIFTASVFENVAAGLTGTSLAYRPDVD